MDSLHKTMLRIIQFLTGLLLKKDPQAVSLTISVSPTMPVGQTISIKQTGVHQIMITLRDDFVLPLVVAGADKKGKAAPLENLTFTSADENLATVDGTGLVTPGALEGVALPATVQITVKADAIIGDGEADLLGTVDIQIVGGQAVTLSVGGTPVPADAAPAGGTPAGGI